MRRPIAIVRPATIAALFDVVVVVVVVAVVVDVVVVVICIKYILIRKLLRVVYSLVSCKKDIKAKK